MSIQFVKSTDDFKKYVSHNKYLVANFTASWCGPCQAIKPVVDQLYSDSNARYEYIEVVRVDLDSQRELATNYTITSVPTFVFIENGKESSRVTGANIPELIKSLDSMNEKAKNESDVKVRAGNGTSSVSSATENETVKQINALIPKGFESLNSSIDFGGFQALNALPLYKTNSEALKNVFKLTTSSDNDKNTVLSDADSQLLFFIPLLNISKVYSILIKFKTDLDSLKTEEEEKLELDKDDFEETQIPNVIKVFANQFNIPTFDEASSAQAPHSESIEKVEGSDWYEAKLKFVRFQSVQTLTIFLDGAEEDYHTLIDKIVVVGISGETKEQGSVNKLEDEE
ncbi:thioredoxin [Scheffersomyces coipomensis]|uniref:thioredoxin n=1 Tax=Scheffersomyces coipomensis TaxID=1788519 RepID=UPI00315D4B9D